MKKYLNEIEIESLNRTFKSVIKSKIAHLRSNYKKYFDKKLELEKAVGVYLELLDIPFYCKSNMNEILYDTFEKNNFISDYDYNKAKQIFIDYYSEDDSKEFLGLPIYIFAKELLDIISFNLEKMGSKTHIASWYDFIDRGDGFDKEISKIFSLQIELIKNCIDYYIANNGPLESEEDIEDCLEENALVIAFENITFDEDIIGKIEETFCYSNNSVETTIEEINEISYLTIGANQIAQGIDMDVLILILIQFYRIERRKEEEDIHSDIDNICVS